MKRNQATPANALTAEEMTMTSSCPRCGPAMNCNANMGWTLDQLADSLDECPIAGHCIACGDAMLVSDRFKQKVFEAKLLMFYLNADEVQVPPMYINFLGWHCRECVTSGRAKRDLRRRQGYDGDELDNPDFDKMSEP